MVPQKERSDKARHVASVGEQDPHPEEIEPLLYPFAVGKRTRVSEYALTTDSEPGSEEAWVEPQGQQALALRHSGLMADVGWHGLL